tara:strand:+ start:2975 stop:3811 length:837 start_codon:yes stop_codon:yes gene_type:complete
MKFGLQRKHGSLNSVPVFDAVAKGLSKLGHTVVNDTTECDIPVLWSMLWHGRMKDNKKIYESALSQKKKVLFLEVGGIKRNTTWKVALNGINRLGYFGPLKNDDTRAKLLGLELKENKKGDDILICCQHDKSHQWRNQPPMQIYIDRLIHELRMYTDRKIIIRPHPRCPVDNKLQNYKNVELQVPKQIANTYDDFDLGFNNIHAVISYSSNPGIHAVLNGTHAFVGPESLAYPVANKELKNIENPQIFERNQWLYDYAYTEWTIEEIAQGLPFSRLTF